MLMAMELTSNVKMQLAIMHQEFVIQLLLASA
jgi:hypothetical protein